MYCSIQCKFFPLFVSAETHCFTLHEKIIQPQYRSYGTVVVILLCDTTGKKSAPGRIIGTSVCFNSIN
jgi:hypothetical protein